VNERVRVIQQAVDLLQATTYLEIGVATARTFMAVNAVRKIGVEPRKPNPDLVPLIDNASVYNFQLKSDDFFAAESGLIAEQPVDVAFVDGLHDWQQAVRDVENCLDHLSDSGLIIMHDCSPTNEIMTTSYDKLEEVRMAGKWHGTSWTGDTWKAIVLLRSTRPDLHVAVLDCDWGLGIITRGKPEGMLTSSRDDVAAMRYNDLDEDRIRLLNLKDPAWFDEFLAAYVHRHGINVPTAQPA